MLRPQEIQDNSVARPPGSAILDRMASIEDPPEQEPSAQAGSGVVTLLFTDMVGSTQLLERLGDDAALEVVETHFRHLREAIARCGGTEVKSLGDGVMVSFGDPVDALRCAVSMQQTVAAENARSPDRAVRLRVGLHAGEPLRAPWLRSREEDFFGSTVVVARRLCDVARGGQILTSELVAGLIGSRGGFRFRPLTRPLVLKGIDQPVATVEVVTSDSLAPALDFVAPARIPQRGPRLVDREQELATLESEFDRSARGEFRCVLLLGDPGVGKTRLATEFLARRRGQVIGLSARGYPLGEPASFGLWSEALERYLRVVPAERVSQLCGGFVEDLAGLLSSVAAVRGSAPDREPPRARLLEALVVLVGNLAEMAPLVIVLDDAHSADASSWEGLAYLGQKAADAPILVVAAARPGVMAAHSVATEVILSLEQDGLLRRLSLQPLDVPSVAALIEAVIGRPGGDALVEWLAQRSGGNALFALGLLQALLEDGADLEAPELRALPQPLADHVRTRLRGLSEQGLAVVQILAVAARPVRLADLAFLTERTPEELSSDHQGLVVSRLVSEEERDRELGYEIAHPLIQEIVYQAIGGARRRGLHRVMGRALLASRRLAEAASHFSRSAGVGDDEAVAALSKALTQAESREAYDETLAILEALAEILPSGDDRWLQVADAMMSAEDWVVHHRAGALAGTAVQAMREIVAALERSPDAGRRAAAMLRLSGFLAWGTHEADEAEQRCREAVELFEQAGDTTRMLLAANELAYVRGLRGDLAAWQEGARRVVEDAVATGRRVAVMHAAFSQGAAAFWGGRFADAEAAYRRAIAVAVEEGMAHRLAWGLAWLSLNHAVEGRGEEALALLEHARSVAPAWRAARLLEQETCVHLAMGDFGAAVATAQEAAALTPAASGRQVIGIAYGALSAIESDAIPEARRLLGRARAACGEPPRFFHADHCSSIEAVLAWREGRPADALDGLRRSASGLLRWRALPFLAVVLLELAEVAAEVGDAAAAGEAADRLGWAADEMDRDLHRAMAATASGWERLASNLPDAAAAAARSALALLPAIGYRSYQGRAEHLLGLALVPADAAAARDAFDRAEASFRAAGARWRLERLQQARRAVGVE
jgi:class 3 adenylate cyclase/tetratricopeptide (TPR) repeat protein